MKPQTIVRLTISSPTFGLFDKAIAVDNDVPKAEQKHIDYAVQDLSCLMLSWLHRGERVDAVEQAISDICRAFHMNEEEFFHPERVKPERKQGKGKSK